MIIKNKQKREYNRDRWLNGLMGKTAHIYYLGWTRMQSDFRISDPTQIFYIRTKSRQFMILKSLEMSSETVFIWAKVVFSRIPAPSRVEEMIWVTANCLVSLSSVQPEDVLVYHRLCLDSGGYPISGCPSYEDCGWFI